jgi:hypothetical protein
MVKVDSQDRQVSALWSEREGTVAHYERSFRELFERPLYVIDTIPGKIVFVYVEQPGESVVAMRQAVEQWASSTVVAGLDYKVTTVQSLVWRSRYCGILQNENRQLRRQAVQRRWDWAIATAGGWVAYAIARWMGWV